MYAPSMKRFIWLLVLPITAFAAVPEAGTPEFAIRHSLQLIRDGKLDEWMTTYCEPGHCDTETQKDERIGSMIIKRALEEPLRTLANNAGLEGSVIVEHVKKESKAAGGFDVDKEKYVDMFEAGIIDPTKVTRVALENAVSIAGVLLLAEATLTEIEEPAKERAPLEE